MGYFLYGSGLRQKECVALRVKDVDLDYGLIIVRDVRGRKDRATILPQTIEPLFSGSCSARGPYMRRHR